LAQQLTTGRLALTSPILIAIGFAACALYAATPQKTQSELRSLRERIEKITQQVSRDAVERDRVSADLRAAELSLSQARAETARIGREYAERTRRRNALWLDKTQQQRALDDGRAVLADQLRAAYLIGRQEPLKLLLEARDPLRGERIFAYYGYLGRARAEQIAQIGQHLQRLDELDAELAQQQSQLAQLKAAQQSQLQQLERARTERHRVLTSLESSARSHEQSLARLKAQQADLEQLLEDLNHSLKEVPLPDTASAFGRLRGQLHWPVAGHIRAQFGDARASGVKWDGLVVATERGEPVKAVSAGRVVYADWLPGLGLLAIIDHGEGYLSLYGHNEQLYKAVGEPVVAGDVIAAAGDTGGRPEPELYFEIRREGHPVDPRPWFRDRQPESRD
jgi:septal ring factor EnvC (AmiA/AmiB activator)